MTKIIAFFMKLFGYVQVNDLDKIQYLGPKKKGLTPYKFYRISGYTGHGVSKDHRTSYEFTGDDGYGHVLWSDEIGESVMKKIWVHKDSLAGILSLVTYDSKWIKLWKQKSEEKKRKEDQKWN